MNELIEETIRQLCEDFPELEEQLCTAIVILTSRAFIKVIRGQHESSTANPDLPEQQQRQTD